LVRASALLSAAADAGPDARERGCARAVAVAREAARDRAATFATSLQGPTSALYAFGVLLPLALVGLLPAAGVAGLGVSLPAVVVVYDLVLPVGLGATSAWLVSTRPVAFPPRSVPSDHPATTGARVRGGLAGLAVGGVTTGLVWTLLPGWFLPVLVPAAAVGTGLVVRYRPVVAVRDRVEALENGLPDALAVVGRRVERGVAVERAIPEAADRVDGPAGDALARAADRAERLGVVPETALSGVGGPLEDLPSERLAEAASLVAVAGRAGPPAGDALVAVADHLDELQAVERESRRAVAEVTDSLAHTAAVFGPLVAGVTVGLADRLPTAGAALGSLGGTPLPTAGLGLAVGGYVVWLAVLLPAVATGLERGFDRARVGHRVGGALLAAGGFYATGFVATRALT
jgi:hypothetical protein